MRESGRMMPRAKTSWPVTIWHPNGEMEGLIAMVNPDGGFVLWSRPLKLDEICWMTVNCPWNMLPRGQNYFMEPSIGRVLWCLLASVYRGRIKISHIFDSLLYPNLSALPMFP